MYRFFSVLCLLCGLAIISSCSSGYPLFVNTTISQTESLKKICEENNIVSIETEKADSLAVAARNKAREGKENEAYWMADASATYYRLAVSKHELTAATAEIAELKKSLSSAREQLNTYKEVLNELENMKNP